MVADSIKVGCGIGEPISYPVINETRTLAHAIVAIVLLYGAVQADLHWMRMTDSYIIDSIEIKLAADRGTFSQYKNPNIVALASQWAVRPSGRIAVVRPGLHHLQALREHVPPPVSGLHR